MRRTLVLPIVAAAVFLACGAWLAARAQSDAYEVPVDSLVIFKKPAPYFGPAGKAARGERLTVLEEKGRWLRVRKAAGADAPAIEGWVLPPTGQQTALQAASETGVGLVTKGFAEGYAKKNGVEPTALGTIEKPQFDVRDIESFVQEGGLRRGH